MCISLFCHLWTSVHHTVSYYEIPVPYLVKFYNYKREERFLSSWKLFFIIFWKISRKLFFKESDFGNVAGETLLKSLFLEERCLRILHEFRNSLEILKGHLTNAISAAFHQIKIRSLDFKHHWRFMIHQGHRKLFYGGGDGGGGGGGGLSKI